MNTYKAELKEKNTEMDKLKASQAQFTKDCDNVGRLRCGVQIEDLQARIDLITGKTVEV